MRTDKIQPNWVKFVKFDDEKKTIIKAVLGTIEPRITLEHPPIIVYVPFSEFPKSIDRDEIIKTLKILQEKFGVIKFLGIVGPNLENQEVDIRTDDDKKAFLDFFEFVQKNSDRINDLPNVKIKNIYFNDADQFLSINNGEIIIPLKSRKSDELNRTKIIKIFSFLWDFRVEKKDGRIIKKGEPVSTDNLRRNSDCPSNNSVARIVARIRNLISEKSLPIKIIGQNGKYWVEIYMS